MEESKKLNTTTEPCIIISASGMCEAGRILHHLANNISDPGNTILIVGYMAENTLGRRLVEKRPSVKIFGEEHSLKAEVVIMNGLSAHADKNELMEYFNALNRSRLQKVFIVHGEQDQSESLARTIQENGFENAIVPELGEKIEI